MRNNRLISCVLVWLMSICTVHAQGGESKQILMRVLVVYGAPGHSSIHLRYGGQQLYWDPGGEYGMEKDKCLEFNSMSGCSRFDGLSLERLKANRRYDVFFGNDAELLRVVSVYHLDGDVRSQIYSFHLEGEIAKRAWDLLYNGGRQGRRAQFQTNRNPMFCVKGVTEYLRELGGRFEDFPSPWFPSDLAKELEKLGARPSHVYDMEDPVIQAYIRDTRRRSGLPQLNYKPAKARE